MPKQPFTPDEMHTIMRWADAYVKEHPETTIGDKSLFPNELDSLKERVAESAPSYLLGMVNAGMLMGFDTLKHAYPLQIVWDRVTNVLGLTMRHEQKILGTFLSSAGFIRKTKEHSEPL